MILIVKYLSVILIYVEIAQLDIWPDMSRNLIYTFGACHGFKISHILQTTIPFGFADKASLKLSLPFILHFSNRKRNTSTTHWTPKLFDIYDWNRNFFTSFLKIFKCALLCIRISISIPKKEMQILTHNE